jgi:hypothetical protein
MNPKHRPGFEQTGLGQVAHVDRVEAEFGGELPGWAQTLPNVPPTLPLPRMPIFMRVD